MKNAIDLVDHDTEIVNHFYELAVEDVLDSLHSPDSKRVYKHTFLEWGDFCHSQHVSPAFIEKDHVKSFLDSLDNTVRTKRRKLSALRKLARKMLNRAEDQRFQYIINRLEDLKIERPDSQEREREKNVLPPEQVYRIFNVWKKRTILHKRNQAVITLLILTGMRRAEVAALKWSDINLEDGIVEIRHGKGDKLRFAAIVGEDALHALRVWREEIPDRIWVFPSLGPDRQLSDDKPTDGQTIYRIVKRTEQLSGVTFSPHDARRTFITESFNGGTPGHDIQVQVGHVNLATTSLYAQGTHAKERRKKFKFRYGG